MKKVFLMLTLVAATSMVALANGDGKNERWEIPYFNILYPQGTVIILDRNGRKLLEYNGNFDGWDGSINGYSASTGVYWYVVQLDKGSIPLRGNFTLIR